MEHKLRRYAAVLAALVMGLCAGLTINVSQFLRTTEPQSRAEEVDAGVENIRRSWGWWTNTSSEMMLTSLR